MLAVGGKCMKCYAFLGTASNQLTVNPKNRKKEKNWRKNVTVFCVTEESVSLSTDVFPVFSPFCLECPKEVF